MIRMVRGAVVARGKDYLVIDVGGIGYKVFVTEPAALSANIDEELMLHTYLQVREDALNLFGFADVEELAMFELLLGVNGVGPKVALATLGASIRRKGAVRGTLDTALDFVPFVGGVKNVVEVVRGRDLLRDRPIA